MPGTHLSLALGQRQVLPPQEPGSVGDAEPLQVARRPPLSGEDHVARSNALRLPLIRKLGKVTLRQPSQEQSCIVSQSDLFGTVRRNPRFESRLIRGFVLVGSMIVRLQIDCVSERWQMGSKIA